MADKDIGGIKFTVDGDDSGLKRVDESMENLQQTAKDTQQGLDNLGGEATKSSKQVKNFGDATEKTEKKTKGMSTAVKAAGAALATYLTIDAAKEIIKTADSFELLNDRIRLATESTGDYVSVQRELYKLSQQTGTALSGNVDLFQRIQIGASELGRSNTDVIQLVESLSKLGTLGGSSSEELNNATVQLSQGLAGGIIRAEEFNSILENTPKIAQSIATGLNVSVGELRNMMLNGELLANDVFDSILSQTTQINEQFDQMPNRIGRAGTSLSNAWSNTVGLLNDATGASSAIADWMDAIAEKLDQRVDYWREELDLVEQMEIQVSSLEAAYRGLGLVQLEARKATLSRMEADLAERVKEVEDNIISLPMDDVIRQNYAAVKAELDEVSKQIEKITGDQEEGANDVNEALEALLKKYPQLIDAEQLLLEEQLLLNAALETTAEKEIPAIVSALEQVRLKLKQIRDERKEDGPLIPVVDSGGSSGMSIFDVGADTQTEFKNQMEGIAPELGKAIGYEIAEGTEKQLDKLDWSQYGGNIGASLGEALVTGDTSMLKGALSGAVGNLATDALTPALTSAFGAGASAFLGPLAGGVAGSLVDGLLAGKQEISRSVEIVFSDGIAQAFTNIEYDSMLGGSSSVIGFEFLDNERITNSLSNTLSELDESIELIGSKVEDFEGVFEGDTIADALDSASEQYINAGFGSIEAFQEFGETASDTLNRITDTLKTTNDAIRNVVGNDTELAIEQYTQGIADAIDTNQELGVEYWQAAKVAITDLATGVLEPVEGAEGDLVRGTESYKRAFDDYLKTVAGGGRFFAGGTTKTGQDLINYIDQNQLPEAISRLGEGMQVATIEFAEELESLIEGGNVTNALESLTNVIATDVENYSEQVNNALEDLEDLGFGGVSISEFGAQYEEALKRTVTPEILANFANAAVLFEKIGDATESLNDELEEQASRVGDLQQEYNALIGRDDLNDLIDYEERLADARSDEEMQLIESIRYQGLLNDARKDEIETLSDYVGLLGTSATEALSDLKGGFDTVIEESAASLDALRNSLNDQIDAEQERADKQVERLQAEQDATETSVSNAKSLINLLDSAMNTLGERSEDLQDKLFTQSFVDIQNAINTARATGELPDAELIEGAVSQLSTAGTGEFRTRVDRERETLQARKLLSDLNDLSEDSLTEAEQQIELLDEQIEAIEESSEATIKALNTQIDDAEEQHKQLIDKFDSQYEAQQEYYDESTAQLQKQLDALNGINNSFESFEQVLSEALNAAGSAVDATVNAGSGSGVTNQDIADYLTQFTNDNFVSDTEAQAIYNKSLEYGVSSSLVGDILNSQLTGGSSINVNDWLSRNNLSSVGGNNMNSMASAVNSMSDRLSAQLSEIAGSSGTTANVLNSSSAPGGFGIVVKQE